MALDVENFLAVNPKGFWLKDIYPEDRQGLTVPTKVVNRLADNPRFRFNRKRLNTIFADFVLGYQLCGRANQKLHPLLFLVFSVPREKRALAMAFDFTERSEENIISSILSCNDILEEGAVLEMIMYCDFKTTGQKKMMIFAAKDNSNNIIHRCFRYYKKRNPHFPLGEEVIDPSLNFWVPERAPEVKFKPVQDEFLNSIKFN